MIRNLQSTFVDPGKLDEIARIYDRHRERSNQRCHDSKSTRSGGTSFVIRLAAAARRAAGSLLRAHSYDGPESLANFERAMRGTRSLAK